jgi:DNA-binding transcriptional LysR family regulator
LAKALSDAALLMRLRTRQLLLLEALGREHNLGRAAAALGMSQPAATKLLQQAEDALGVRLFTRLARGMEPTPTGEVLIRFARQSLVDFGFAREQMAALRSGLRGRLRLGSVPGALPSCWRRRWRSTSASIRAWRCRCWWRPAT